MSRGAQIAAAQSGGALRLADIARGRKRVVSGGLRGSWPCDTLISASSLLNCETANFRCPKPPSVWYVVTGTPGNEYGVAERRS